MADSLFPNIKNAGETVSNNHQNNQYQQGWVTNCTHWNVMTLDCVHTLIGGRGGAERDRAGTALA